MSYRPMKKLDEPAPRLLVLRSCYRTQPTGGDKGNMIFAKSAYIGNEELSLRKQPLALPLYHGVVITD